MYSHFALLDKSKLNLPLNQPDPCTASGNRDNANMAKEFLSVKNRDKVLDLYHTSSQEQRDQLETLLQHMSVILRVSSSTQKIKTNEFHQFNLQTYQKLVNLFPWMDVQDSIHGLFHSAQFIEKYNNSYGLGQLSESALGKFFDSKTTYAISF